MVVNLVRPETVVWKAALLSACAIVTWIVPPLAHAGDGRSKNVEPVVAGHEGIKRPPSPRRPGLPPTVPTEPKPVPIAPQTASLDNGWSGFYVGVQTGATFRAGSTDDGVSPYRSGDRTAPVFGMLAGYNVQYGAFVVGIEGDITLAPAAQNWLTQSGVFAIRDDAQFALRLRSGIELPVGGLGFVSAGGTGGQWHGVYTGSASGPLFVDLGWRTGWTASVGYERNIGANWIGRIEYRYSNFGAIAHLDAAAAGSSPLVRASDDGVVFTLGYRFK